MRGRTVLLVLAGLALGGVLFALGRVTASGDAGDHSAGGTSTAGHGYSDGYRDGHADGLRDGRALQVTQSLPPDSRDASRAAFDAGYTAGANDVFNGYDGGWGGSEPWLVTLSQPGGPITYRIAGRTQMQAGTNYFLCPKSRTICQEKRP